MEEKLEFPIEARSEYDSHKYLNRSESFFFLSFSNLRVTVILRIFLKVS